MTSTLEKPNIPMENMFTKQPPRDIMVRRWQSFFDQLFKRVGSDEALTNTELKDLIDDNEIELKRYILMRP